MTSPTEFTIDMSEVRDDINGGWMIAIEIKGFNGLQTNLTDIADAVEKVIKDYKVRSNVRFNVRQKKFLKVCSMPNQSYFYIEAKPYNPYFEERITLNYNTVSEFGSEFFEDDLYVLNGPKRGTYRLFPPPELTRSTHFVFYKVSSESDSDSDDNMMMF